MHGEARKTEERAERNREAAADERHDPDDGRNCGLGSKQSLLPRVPEPREGLQQQRMQVPLCDAGRFETDRDPVQVLQVRRTPIDDPAFSLRGPLDPHNRFEVADDAVAHRGLLGVGKADKAL